jgi:Zn-dependent M28 family amino/carboxypeptidase
VFTAEERGLLGSQHFVAHPTVPRAQLVANINLDALRPIFPLRSLTGLGIERSTLGEVERVVASSMDITIKPDAEPDRNLLRRSDLWSFLQAGIPSLAFVFGYEPGSSEETIYRRGTHSAITARLMTRTNRGIPSLPRASMNSSRGSFRRSRTRRRARHCSNQRSRERLEPLEPVI